MFKKEDLTPTAEDVARLARDLQADLERLERPREVQHVSNSRTPNAVHAALARRLRGAAS